MRITLTEEQLKTLRSELTRTGLSIGKLFKREDVCPPRYMSQHIAQNWLHGQVKTALKENWDWFLQTCAAIPDADPKSIRVTARYAIERASPEDRMRVRAEYERTGVGGRGIFRFLDSTPEGLCEEDCIQAVSRPKSVRRASHVEAILAAYAKLPDTEYKPLDSRTQQEVRAELLRTALSPSKVIEALGDDAPTDLSAQTIYHWSTGMVKTAKPDYVERVLVVLRDLPDGMPADKRAGRPRKKKPESAPRISQAQFNLLWDLRRRSGVSPHAVLKERDDIPSGLTPSLINGWLFKKPEAFSQEHFDYVVQAYKAAIKPLKS